MSLDLSKLLKEQNNQTSGLRQQIIERLRTIYDPELPLNIYDLGLIYKLEINEEQGKVQIEMTLTSPGCPVAQTFPGTVEYALQQVPGVKTAQVELVWDPPWNQDSLSEMAKLQLGLL